MTDEERKGQEEEVEEPTSPEPEDSAGDPETDTDTQPGPVPYDRFKEVNERNKALADRIADLERKQQEREEEAEKRRRERLKEQEKFQELAEEHEEALEELRPKYQSAQERLEEMEDILEAHADAQMERVPEVFRDVVRKLPVLERLSWLTENAEKLDKKTPKGVPSTPEGRRRSELTENERRKRAARTF